MSDVDMAIGMLRGKGFGRKATIQQAAGWLFDQLGEGSDETVRLAMRIFCQERATAALLGRRGAR